MAEPTIEDYLREHRTFPPPADFVSRALVTDPSIYDDLKRVLGNVERNSVLRALVRYSIKRDEDRPQAEVGGK